jgi:hypothetical protein
MGGKRPIKDLTGKKFGRWTVIRLYSSELRKVAAQNVYIRYWWCRCDCGNEKPVHRQLLVSGKSTSCGCYQRENSHNLFSKTGTARKKVLLQYKRSAKHRSIEWSLSDEQLYALIESPCYYTGQLPSGKKTAKSGETFLYNGVDRLDNSKGYTPDNCVPCCWEVNRMKNDMTKERFLELCKAISERNNNEQPST